jgi:hypothetical protein
LAVSCKRCANIMGTLLKGDLLQGSSKLPVASLSCSGSVCSGFCPRVARARPCGLGDLSRPCGHSPPSVSVVIPWQISHLLSCAKATSSGTAIAIHTTCNCGETALVRLQVAHSVTAVEEGAEVVPVRRGVGWFVAAEIRETGPRVGLHGPFPSLVILPDASKLCAALSTAWMMNHSVSCPSRKKTSIREATTRVWGAVHGQLIGIPRNLVHRVVLRVAAIGTA